jgi:transposase, IS30 family
VSSLTKEPAGQRKYTPEEKAQFFQAHDGLGSVTDAASELGLNRMTCYQWCRRAGIRNEQAVRMKYTPGQKDDFYLVFRRVGSVTLAASELGLNVSTCHRWASKAEIASKAPGPGRREEFLRLHEAGMSRSEAITVVGVHPKTAREWERGDPQVRRPTQLPRRTGHRLQTWCDHDK